MERRAIIIRGVVQGVGFRPFVYKLAAELDLAGFVKNQAGSVLIEAEGEREPLERFMAALADRPPTLAQIESIRWEPRAPLGELEFRIASSESDGPSPVYISPDVATCPECLAELFDPADRRFGYPFLNCTNCGPRLSIITGAPYDRAKTTMARFAMCDACRAEYEDPGNRRFHAQPTACPVCGPRLEVRDVAGRAIAANDPLEVFAGALRDGKIGALKGLGGYQLACVASDSAAVSELRRRKGRDEKPFAVMVPDADAAAVLGVVGPVERALLSSPQAPIVLLRKGPNEAVAPEVAPRNAWLGVMVAYTPLHHLLLRALGGIPLVMTSGNRSDEPIAFGDDAVDTLAGIADLFLVHDRPIHVRCDDSVTRVAEAQELPVRRSRGYAPRPIELPVSCRRPLLAVGGQLKATFALGRDRQAFLSQHMGDLDHFGAYRAFEKDVALYQELFAVTPSCLVHDLHPDYATTRYAQARAAREGIPLLSVQHHHAHMASCMAENGLAGPVIGVTFDGTGYGTDGTIWGGEFLVGNYREFRRSAHLRPVGMPGGDRAIRDPWRMAVAHLADARADAPSWTAQFLQEDFRLILKMLERQINSPHTSSAGRLFDAVAALAGVRNRVSYEGQAAVELEWLASGVPADGAYPFGVGAFLDGESSESSLIVDTRPLIRAVVDDVARGVGAAVIARRFHSTLVDLIAEVCRRIRQKTGIGVAVLTGGVFLNVLLSSEVSARLAEEGFRAYRHRRVPPNDGGLSLGQLAVAACADV